MQRSRPISLWFTVLVVAASLWSCANIGHPSGGDKDSAGPEVLGVLPYPGTLYFNYKEIEFHFDEFLKPGNYKDEVFISPVPLVEPEIIVKNKILRIRFIGPLRENTTYVVTLGSGIKDFNEGNKMSQSYTYAFSTGGVLDSLRFGGQVADMWSGQAESDMKVLLFRADAIEDNDIKGKRPEYMVSTDKEGKFEFKFLAPGDYKVYGVSDADNNNRFTGNSEKIALAASPNIHLVGGDSVRLNVPMTSFFQDQEAPLVKNAKWSNPYTIHVEFSEPIRERYGSDSLRIELTDTTGANAKPVTVKRFRYLDHEHLYIHADVPRDRDYDLHFTNLMDSLGQKSDVKARVSAQAQVREERGRWYEPPLNLRRGHEFAVAALFKLPASIDTAQVQLIDTAGVSQLVEWHTDGFMLYGKPPKMLLPTMEYRLRLKKNMLLPDGKTVDSLVTFKMTFPNPDDFGTMTGLVLPDSTRPTARFHVILRGGTGSGLLITSKAGGDRETKGKTTNASTVPNRFEERFEAPAAFKYVYMHPGSYSIDIIDDVDGNGVVTPGSLMPYVLPEKVYHQATPVDIKAKWDLKDVQIYPIPQAGKAVSGKGGGAAGGKSLGK
jgi:Bacterial Ig-like domain